MTRAALIECVFLVISQALGVHCVASNLPELSFDKVELFPNAHFSNYALRVMEDSNGFLWVASSSGLFRYDGKRVEGYFHSADSNSLSANYCEALLQHSDGSIWIGTLNGLSRYNFATNDFERIGQDEMGGIRIAKLFEDRNQDIWASCGDGLRHYKGQEFSAYAQNVLSPVNSGFRMIFQDPLDSSTLWVGGVGGLFSFDLTTGTFEHYPMNRRSPGVIDYMIMGGYIDDENVMVCGTWGTSVVPFDLNNRKWREDEYLFPDDALWHHTIFDIWPYKAGQYWVATGEGFGLYDRREKSITYFTSDDDPEALHDSPSYMAVCTTKQGVLIVAGDNLLSVAPLDPIGPPKLHFPPLIDDIVIDGRPMQGDTATSYKRHITLGDHEKDLFISIITPGNYLDQELEFAYKLNGYDRDWIVTESTQLARYTNLPAGDYEFNFKCRFPGQEWVEGRVVGISKSIVFYKRPWFQIGLGLMLFGIILLISVWRVRSIRSREKLKTEFNKRLGAVEMSALRAQMNPHFMFNSLNSIKYYILNEEPDNANKYLTKFSKLMRLVLNNSKTSFVTLADELLALELYIELESLRFKHSFEYRIDVASEIDSQSTYIPPMIIQPYVENAIWHGLLQKNGPGQLLISAQMNREQLSIYVEDNGIGREAASRSNTAAAPRRSYGTQITKDRIDLINETLGISAAVAITDLYADDGSPAGTLVTIVLPLLDESQLESRELNSA